MIKNMNHLWIGIFALSLIGLYFQPWAMIDTGVSRPVFGSDNPIAWGVFGLATVSFMVGMISFQARSRSFITHVSCSTIALIGTLMVTIGLLAERSMVIKHAVDSAEQAASFTFTGAFALGLVLQVAWFTLSLLSMGDKDRKPFLEMRELKPALVLPLVV